MTRDADQESVKLQIIASNANSIAVQTAIVLVIGEHRFQRFIVGMHEGDGMAMSQQPEV